MNIPALCSLESITRFVIIQRDLQLAVNQLAILASRSKKLGLQLSEPGIGPNSNLHIDTINPSCSLRVKLGDVMLAEFHQLLLPLKHHMMQNGRVLVALVKRYRIGQSHETKLLLSIGSRHFDPMVIHASPYARVSDGDVEGEVVVESTSVVVGGEIELGERSIGDSEFGVLGKEDEP